MKPQLVGPWWAAVLVCVAQAVMPVCRRSAIVCVAACSAARTAWAAVPECVSLHMQLVLRAPLRAASLVRLAEKAVKCEIVRICRPEE